MIMKFRRDNGWAICIFFHMMSVSYASDEIYWAGVGGVISATSPHLPTPVVTLLLTAMPLDDWCHVAACRFDSQINYTHNECLQHEIWDWPVRVQKLEKQFDYHGRKCFIKINIYIYIYHATHHSQLEWTQIGQISNLTVEMSNPFHCTFVWRQ
jgi:hypothetical protein